MTMFKRSALLLFISLILVSPIYLIAQSAPSFQGAMIYGETVSGVFHDETPSPHIWEFTGNEREMLRVHVQRIGGQFSPQMALYGPDNAPLVPTIDQSDLHRQTLQFEDGLSQSGTYRIEISGSDVSNSIINLNEYALTLENIGLRRANTDEGLSALPVLGLNDMPDLFGQSATADATLNVALYGSSSVTQPDPLGRRNQYVVSGSGRSISLDNANPISRDVQTLSFVAGGIGFTTVNNIQFFTDQDITDFSYNQAIMTLTLQNGQQIITDFYRIKRIQAVQNMVIVTTDYDQRLLLKGSSFEFKRRGGIAGSGPNVEPINEFKVDDNNIASDLMVWHTLAYLPENNSPVLRVLYGADMRFISTTGPVELLQRGNQEKPELNPPGTDPHYIDICLNALCAAADSALKVLLNIDPTGMGDVSIHQDTLRVQPLDGREITESVSQLQNLLVENKGVRFQRRDNSYRLSLPDQTDIETPANPEGVNGLRNFANLGVTIFDYHPGVQFDQALYPFNRVSGNFNYAITDFSIPSHTLGLTWERAYNSLARADLTPAYMRNTPRPYLFGRMGLNWRHSYQYELDVTLAPHNQVTLILPDGSHHIFRQIEGLYRSNSLLSWAVQQFDGVTGRWTVRTLDGNTYEFDRAGRLQSITASDGGLLLFSEAPRNLTQAAGYADGFFVTELYGRRLEIYTNTDQRIALARDMQQREIFYQYDANGLLIAVDYPDASQQATYSYSNNQLTGVDDPRSPYHQQLALFYDAANRLTEFTINATQRDNSLPVSTLINYDNGITSETIIVNGETRVSRWRYDTDFYLNGYDSPVAGWSQEFNYDLNNRRLKDYGQFNGTYLTFVYDQWGYLTELTDPATHKYLFEYETLESFNRVLKKISFPALEAGVPTQTFTYENGRLVTMTQLITTRPQSVEQVTQFEYDDFARLSLVRRLGAHEREITTTYTYDDFGYLRQISEGDVDGIRTLQLEHDIAGRLLSLTDWRGYVTTLDWNNERDLITAISRAEEETAYRYDDYGNLIELITPAITENYLYNGLNQMVAFTDALGYITSYSYDEAGNLLVKNLPDIRNTGQQVYSYTYDGNNQLIQMNLPGALSYRYTSVINRGTDTRYSVTNPAGEVTQYTYNVLGRLVNVAHADTQNRRVYEYGLAYNPLGYLLSIEEKHDPSGRVLALRYDLLGNPVSSSIDNKAETRYSYTTAGFLQSVTDPIGQITTYTYDAWGNITRVQLPDETTREYAYDEVNNLILYQDGRGNTSEYVYNPQNRLSDFVDALGNRTSYNYDAFGNLIKRTDARGNVVQAEYNALNLLMSLTEADGTHTGFEYNELSQLTRMTIPRGIQMSFTYDLWGNIIAETLTNSRETLYAYDNLHRLVSSTNTLGYTEQYAYNNLNRVGRIIDPLGKTDIYSWVGDGRILSHSDADGRTTTYTSDDLGRLSRVIGPAGQTDIRYNEAGAIQEITLRSTSGSQESRYRYEYDVKGRLVGFADPETPNNVWWRFEYDPDDNLTARITPDNQRTSYTYDAANRVTRVEYPDNALEHYEYDGVGNIIQFIAANGLISDYQYDQKNRLTQRIDTAQDGQTRTYLYGYDELDNLERIIDPNGHETRYQFDEFGNVRRIGRQLDAEHPIEYRYNYDALNNLTSIQLPPAVANQPGDSINMTYNALNQRVRYVDAGSRVWAYSYDRVGNLAQISDPLGSLTGLAYDDANRLYEITYPNEAVVELRYADQGQQSQVSIPENFAEDPVNRVRAIYSFDRNTNLIGIEHSPREITHIMRDVMGRIAEVTTANGQRITYTYDPRGRLQTINTPEGTTQRDYDLLGRLIRITGSGQTIQYRYNDFGHLVEMAQNDLTIRYRYDDLGNLLEEDAGQFGMTNYEYDALYRLVRVTTGDNGLSITYNDIGLRTALRYDDGLSVSYEYDSNGRMIAVGYVNSDGQRLDRFAYQYDAVGNITRITRADQWKVLYGYDSHHQLIGERWLDASNQVMYAVSYSYDLAGNRMENVLTLEQSNPQRTVYSYNNLNQLTGELRGASFDSVDRFTGEALASQNTDLTLRYEYNQAGSLTRIMYVGGNEMNLTYDSLNRMVGVNGVNLNGEPVNTSIRYDVLGRISEVQANDQNYRLIYDLDQLIAVQNLTSGTMERYIFNGDEVAWVEAPAGRSYPLYDALGSVRHYINAEGQLSSEQVGLSYNAFGEMITPYGAEAALQPDLQPRPLFAGQWYEPASGLYLMGVRAYSPHLGRFIQRDPVRYDPQNSLYIYAANRPGVYTDPSGARQQLAYPGLEAVLQSQATIESPRPSVLLPDIPAPHSVQQLQEQENHRILRVMQMARFEMNAIVASSDPGLCDFHIIGASPLPQHARVYSNARILRNLSRYTPHSGWLPAHEPALLSTNDPYSSLQTLDQHRYLTTTGGRILQQDNCDTRLPIPDSPLATINHPSQSSDFFNLLHEVPLYPVMGQQLPQWLDFPDSIQPVQPPATLRQTITPEIYPQMPDPLARLEAQTEMWTYMTLFSPFVDSACCLQTGTQAFDVAPPVFETFPP